MDKLKLDYLQILRAAKPGLKFWWLTTGVVSIILVGSMLYAFILWSGDNRESVIRENKILHAVYKPQVSDDPAIKDAVVKLRGFFETLDSQRPLQNS